MAGVGYARSRTKNTPDPGDAQHQTTGQSACQLDSPTAPRLAFGAAGPVCESGGCGRGYSAQREPASRPDGYGEPLGRESGQLQEARATLSEEPRRAGRGALLLLTKRMRKRLVAGGAQVSFILDRPEWRDSNSVCVGWWRRVLPLLWDRLAPGASGFAVQRALLDVVASWLSPWARVLLLDDREFGRRLGAVGRAAGLGGLLAPAHL